ncbi:MAG: AIR synthase-related protein, partial [Terrimicrobiaceae bacterium]|nr:AIR synthase-related protein [Terrimicrobiaceae bacterium]
AAVSVAGWAPRGRALLRSGGRPGHYLYVTGRLGGSLARKHWAFKPRLAEGQWLLAEGLPSAMMDISDGLAADLPRLAGASGCGYSLDLASIPRSRGASLEAALGDGEDYELLLAVPPARARRLESGWKANFPGVELTKIGELTACGRIQPVNLVGGFDHFRESVRS